MAELVDAIENKLHLSKKKKKTDKESSQRDGSKSSSSSASDSDESDRENVTATLSELRDDDKFDCVLGQHCFLGDAKSKLIGNASSG